MDDYGRGGESVLERGNSRVEIVASGFGQAVGAGLEDEQLVFDFGVEKEFELLEAALDGRRALEGEHLQHLVDALDAERFEVGQHADDVGPVDLEAVVALLALLEAGLQLALLVLVIVLFLLLLLLLLVGAGQRLEQHLGGDAVGRSVRVEPVAVVADLLEDAVRLPDVDAPAQVRNGQLQPAAQLVQTPLRPLLEVADDGGQVGRHRKLDAPAVVELQLQVDRAALRQPVQTAAGLDRLVLGVVARQLLLDAVGQLHRLVFELVPVLGRDDQRRHGQSMVDAAFLRLPLLLLLLHQRLDVRVDALRVGHVLEHHLAVV